MGVQEEGMGWMKNLSNIKRTEKEPKRKTNFTYGTLHSAPYDLRPHSYRVRNVRNILDSSL